MRKMFRLNADGTVDVCDDTPDADFTGAKYMRSAMREDMWVFIGEDMTRIYIHKSEVPKVIKMFDLLEP